MDDEEDEVNLPFYKDAHTNSLKRIKNKPVENEKQDCRLPNYWALQKIKQELIDLKESHIKLQKDHKDLLD